MRRPFLRVLLYLTVAPRSVITKLHSHKRILNGFLHFARQTIALEVNFQDLMVRDFKAKFFGSYFYSLYLSMSVSLTRKMFSGPYNDI